jgi:hypothetical protein
MLNNSDLLMIVVEGDGKWYMFRQSTFFMESFFNFSRAEEFGLSLFAFSHTTSYLHPRASTSISEERPKCSQIPMGCQAALRQRQSSNDTITTLKENQNDLVWNVSVVNGHRSSARHGKKSASSSQ